MASYATSIPARLDRLPWSRFHWTLVIALGVTWVLDGLEVTLLGAISGVLELPGTLNLTAGQIGMITSFYLMGAVTGSLFFGFLTDRFGRRKLFFITLWIYLLGVVLSAFSWNLWSFCLFRFMTGMGVGGEYSAINSTIDELIPARVRGRIDIMINGSYWLGAAFGSVSTLLFLNPRLFAVDTGWRIGFAVGGIIGLTILFLRRHVPESPRWLVMHGRLDRAEKIVEGIERRIEATGVSLDRPAGKVIVKPSPFTHPFDVARLMFRQYRRRSLVCMILMTSQAFLYNAIFFTYALVLTNFYSLPASVTGLYLLPFAIGNLIGPFVLGPFFDSIGRRKMIAATYFISAVLLAITGYLFSIGALTAHMQTLLWTAVFFFGSAAASSAYLTVSEVFPLEIRGVAIALFVALGTGVGGIVAPWLFGELIGTGSRVAIFQGYLFAAFLLGATAFVQWKYGVDAEGKPLEHVAKPLSVR